MKNKFFWPVVGGVFLVLGLFVWSQNIRQGQNPIVAFRTSLIEGEGATVEELGAVAEDGVENETFESIIANALVSLESKLERGVLMKQNSEFPLILGRKIAEEEYVIPENTCQNGVRLVLKSDPVSIAQEEIPVVTVTGINRQKSRATFARELQFSKKQPYHIFHLPSTLIQDDDSVFPEYKVSEVRFAGNVTLDALCY